MYEELQAAKGKLGRPAHLCSKLHHQPATKLLPVAQEDLAMVHFDLITDLLKHLKAPPCTVSDACDRQPSGTDQGAACGLHLLGAVASRTQLCPSKAADPERVAPMAPGHLTMAVATETPILGPYMTRRGLKRLALQQTPCAERSAAAWREAPQIQF